jgi:hypothetical protein
MAFTAIHWWFSHVPVKGEIIYILDWGRAECEASLGQGKYMNYAQPSCQDLVYLSGERKLQIVECKLRSESGSESCSGKNVFCKIVAILGLGTTVPLTHILPSINCSYLLISLITRLLSLGSSSHYTCVDLDTITSYYWLT